MAERMSVSAWRAAVNRVRWWWLRHMAWPGLAAVMLTLIGVVLAFVVRPGIAETQSALLKAYVARLDATVRLSAAASAPSQRDPRDALRDAWPSVAQRGATVTTLLEVLANAKLIADRAEYTAEDEAPNLVRLRVVVPVKGGYRPARALIAAVLNTLPNAALDGVALERAADAAEAELSGHLRFSLFFRKEAP
jgi:hypothetical protein